MACFSPAKTEQFESKTAETVKAFAAGAKAFPNSPWCLTPLRRSPLLYWSQREGRVSDRKTGVRCKRVIDHKIPALSSAFAQGRRGAGSFGVIPP
jgi:hypothetical protein